MKCLRTIAFCHTPEPWFVCVVVKAKSTQTKEGAIEEKVLDLVAIRASQLNGCILPEYILFSKYFSAFAGSFFM